MSVSATLSGTLTIQPAAGSRDADTMAKLSRTYRKIAGVGASRLLLMGALSTQLWRLSSGPPRLPRLIALRRGWSPPPGPGDARPGGAQVRPGRVSCPAGTWGPSRAEIATAPYFAGLAPPCVMVRGRLTQVDRLARFPPKPLLECTERCSTFPMYRHGWGASWPLVQ